MPRGGRRPGAGRPRKVVDEPPKSRGRPRINPERTLTVVERQQRSRDKKRAAKDCHPTGRYFARHYDRMTIDGILRVFRGWVWKIFRIRPFSSQDEMFRIFVKIKRALRTARLLLLEPREHGKTDLILWFIVWLLYERPFWTYYPLGAYITHKRLSRDVTAWFDLMVWKNPRILDFYGDLKATNCRSRRSVYFRPELRNELQINANLTIPREPNITGFHLDFIFIDDPLSESCRSKPSEINNLVAWYAQNADSCLNEGGFEGVIGTRKMKFDFYEYIKDLKTSKVIKHAAINSMRLLELRAPDNEINHAYAWGTMWNDDLGIDEIWIRDESEWDVMWNPNDTIKNSQTGELEPKWHVRRYLEKYVKLGPLYFSCEYQNNPEPPEGKHFKRTHFTEQRFRINIVGGVKYIVRDDGIAFPFYEAIENGTTITYDPTGQRSKVAISHHDLDYACVLLGFKWKHNYYILDFRLMQNADFEDQVNAYVKMRDTWGNRIGVKARCYAEKSNKAGIQQIQLLERRGIYIDTDNMFRQTDDKYTRIIATSKGPVHARKVWWLYHDDLPPADWMEMVSQWVGIGQDGVHDDGPDACEMFMRVVPENYIPPTAGSGAVHEAMI